MNDVDPPSRTPAVTGVELGVGLSMAFAALAFFLHSNATWSLHSLWQFIPQSVQTEECSTSQNRRRSYITDNTVHFMFCRRSPQTSCVSCQAKTIALVSHERQRWGGGGGCGSDCRLHHANIVSKYATQKTAGHFPRVARLYQ